MTFGLLTRFPLLALRHFEAVVRLGSFERAAHELGVTPSAVSQQVRQMESRIGFTLFERAGNRVLPTERALELAGTLAEGFELIQSGLLQASNNQSQQSVKIRLYQTWANRWLIPRLEGFAKHHPDISVEFETGIDDVDFGRTDADMALSMGAIANSSVRAQEVMRPRLAPVCTPRLAERLQSPDDLANVPRIASRNRMSDWGQWLGAANLMHLDQKPLLVFSNSTLAYEAALGGAGVAVAHLELIQDDIRRSNLVCPFAVSVDATRPIYLFEHKIRARRPGVVAFKQWLLKEIESISPSR